MGVSGPGSGGRWPTAGAVMVCDDMALEGEESEEQKLKFSLGARAVRADCPVGGCRMPYRVGTFFTVFFFDVGTS